jgi:hypothetical protein
VTAPAEVTYQRRGPAVWIRLNRPAQRSALTPTMLAEAKACAPTPPTPNPSSPRPPELGQAANGYG